MRFALEAREAVGIVRERLGQHLDRDVAIELVSRARYTSPMPPAPSGTPMVYAPRRVPGVSGMMKPILCATGAAQISYTISLIG